jgi:hypothetical protein
MLEGGVEVDRFALSIFFTDSLLGYSPTSLAKDLNEGGASFKLVVLEGRQDVVVEILTWIEGLTASNNRLWNQ